MAGDVVVSGPGPGEDAVTAAASLLRSLGWTLVPPLSSDLPCALEVEEETPHVCARCGATNEDGGGYCQSPT